MFKNIKAQHRRRDHFLKTVSIQTDLQWAKPCHMAYYFDIYRGNVIDVNIERNVLLASHYLSRPHAKWRRRVSPRQPSRKIIAVRSVEKKIRAAHFGSATFRFCLVFRRNKFLFSNAGSITNIHIVDADRQF
jgi:hypothetical protein